MLVLWATTGSNSCLCSYKNPIPKLETVAYLRTNEKSCWYFIVQVWFGNKE